MPNKRPKNQVCVEYACRPEQCVAGLAGTSHVNYPEKRPSGSPNERRKVQCLIYTLPKVYRAVAKYDEMKYKYGIVMYNIWPKNPNLCQSTFLSLDSRLHFTRSTTNWTSTERTRSRNYRI